MIKANSQKQSKHAGTEKTRRLPVLSTRTKIMYGNVFQVGSLSSKKRLFVSLEGWGKKTSGSLCGEKNVLEQYLIIIKEAKYI